MGIEIRVNKPKMLELVDPEQNIELIISDISGGDGPIWRQQNECLYFNNVGDSSTWSFNRERGLRHAFCNGTLSKGMCVTKDGRLAMCEQATGSIAIRNADGTKRKVLADYYGDNELNAPCDIVQRSDGILYFTDPALGRGADMPKTSGSSPYHLRSLYAFNLEKEELTQIVSDFENLVCLCFSPDEKQMYIGDMENQILIYDVNINGNLENERLFIKLSDSPGGMKTDQEGNLLVASPQTGLNWYTPEGELLGTIVLPMPQNLTWGENDFKTLYVTTSTCVYRMRTRIAGQHRRV